MPTDLLLCVLSFITFGELLLMRALVSKSNFVQWQHIRQLLCDRRFKTKRAQYKGLDVLNDMYDKLEGRERTILFIRFLIKRLLDFFGKDFQQIFGDNWRMGFLSLRGPTRSCSAVKAEFVIWCVPDHPVLIRISSRFHFTPNYVQIFKIHAEKSPQNTYYVSREAVFTHPDDSHPGLTIGARIYSGLTDQFGNLEAGEDKEEEE